MKRRLDDELKKIKEKVSKMGLLVEQSIDNAAASLFDHDKAKAQQVIQQDQDINLYEIEIDELGHELIARFQPTAVDLRFITMVLKMTSDLERIGDQAVNIAEKGLLINQEKPLKPYEDLPKMASQARTMVRDALDAFIEGDHTKAEQILEEDDVMDHLNDQVYSDVQQIMESQPKSVRIGVSLIMVAHNLERIGDLATNIAEDVIYLKRGVDVRHHIRERRED